MLLKRVVIGAALLTALLIAFVGIRKAPNDMTFLAILSVVVAGGLYEFYCLVEKTGARPYKALGIVFSLAAVFCWSQMVRGTYELLQHQNLLFAFIVLLFLWQALGKKSQIKDAAATAIGFFYLWLFWLCLAIIYQNPRFGLPAVALTVFSVKVGDIAAYFSGSAIGKHKLIPRISPKKSIEGTVFGIAACAAVAFLAVTLFPKSFFYFSHWEAIIFGCSLGIMGLFGDLSESAVKRQAGVKDSSRLFGDMGGVLDLIDSLIFAAPTAYFLLLLMG